MFRQQLMATPLATLNENGASLPADTNVEVIDVGPREIHLNLGLNGSSPRFKEILDRAETDAAFRRELLQDPKAALASSMGNVLPAEMAVRVHEPAKAGTLRLFVPPLREESTSELSDADLEEVAGGGLFKNVRGAIGEWLCKDTHVVEINDQNNSYQVVHDTSNKPPTNEVGSLIVW